MRPLAYMCAIPLLVRGGGHDDRAGGLRAAERAARRSQRPLWRHPLCRPWRRVGIGMKSEKSPPRIEPPRITPGESPLLAPLAGRATKRESMSNSTSTLSGWALAGRARDLRAFEAVERGRARSARPRAVSAAEVVTQAGGGVIERGGAVWGRRAE